MRKNIHAGTITDGRLELTNCTVKGRTEKYKYTGGVAEAQ